jgi:hypothetical protein
MELREKTLNGFWMIYRPFSSVERNGTVFGKRARLYFKGQISKDEAKKRLGCYNLDTGYNLRVKKKRKSAVIEFQHSWSKYGAGPVNQ